MDHPPHSPPFSFLLFPKLKKKCPEGWRFTDNRDIQRNVTLFTASYSRKRFSRLLPAEAPSCHEMNGFTKRICW
jgi:hypothetical protein